MSFIDESQLVQGDQTIEHLTRSNTFLKGYRRALATAQWFDIGGLSAFGRPFFLISCHPDTLLHSIATAFQLHARHVGAVFGLRASTCDRISANGALDTAVSATPPLAGLILV